MKYIIYRITNTINGKIYIGYHRTKDINDGYMGSGLYIRRAIEKHGVSSFTKDIIHFCDDEESMKSMESEIVNEEFINRSDTYNMKIGGHGGFMSGYVTVPGKQVTVEEFNRNTEYHGVCKNKVPVFNSEGISFQVDKSDERIKSGELIRCFEKNGLIDAINSSSEIVRLTKDEYRRGNFTSIHKNVIMAKDINGNIIRTNRDDERYINGELVGITKGMNVNISSYLIYDDLDNIRYKINNESFTSFCKSNNLPWGALLKSHQSGGKKIYQKVGSNEKKLVESNLLKYKGWYCKRII